MNRQFPPEIIQLIVEASLDRYDMFRSNSRNIWPCYATLRSYSLLNSTWCGASQAELVRRVQIRTEESAKKFLEIAEQSGGSVDGVKDLFINSAYFTDASTLVKLLRCAPKVINLRVNDGTVDIHDLAQLQQLRRLELVDCSITSSPPSSLLRLPHLRRLSLVACPIDEWALHFLTPAFLPRLRHLHVRSPALAHLLVQQLEIITSDEGYDDYTVLVRAESLLLLPLPRWADERVNMLSQLRSLPPFLHINIAPVIVDVQPNNNQLVGVLEDLLETKKPGLRVILLNDYGIDDSIKSVIQQFLERGVRVQFLAKYLDFERAIIEMEKIREKGKRAAEAKGWRTSVARVGS